MKYSAMTPRRNNMMFTVMMDLRDSLLLTLPTTEQMISLKLSSADLVSTAEMINNFSAIVMEALPLTSAEKLHTECQLMVAWAPITKTFLEI